jgi:oxalyl-CoA decarboxylase
MRRPTTRSRRFVEKSGIPFLPMSMAKGLLPDTHPQCAGAARSTVLKDSDVVMLIGARLNWLLSHGKGKSLGRSAQEIHPDRHRAQGNGLECRDRRTRGRRYRLLRRGAARGMGGNGRPAPADWTGAVKPKSAKRTSPRWRRG